MKRFLTVSTVLLLCCALTACSDDKKTRPRLTPPDPDYKNLTEKWHVLHNLRQAYNEMNIVEYRKIFDEDNFIFFFYEGDVGGHVPVQWGYAEETQSAENMFSRAGGIEDNPILAIDLTLFDHETVTWTEVPDPEGFPGETWYEAIVVYDFFIETADDIQYITSGAPTAIFTVRQIDGKWKLVRWRDRSSIAAVVSLPSSTEESNWSKLKALYQ